nr:13495_t:CDS:2 [Entrophospora candida]CAG8553554.1 11475_t:CDS:2 [Entrophospora candida]
MDVILRIGILAARDLAPADKNGLSDPYAVIRVANKKFETKVIKENLNPVWDTSFDVKLSEPDIPVCITITVWDKDKFLRDYLGEVSIPISRIFARNNGGLNDGQPRTFEDPKNQPAAFTLQSKSSKHEVRGDIVLKFGIVSEGSEEDLYYLWEKICRLANAKK